MKKLKGVCIGAGYFSQFHFEAWQRMNDVLITGICDTQEGRAEKVRQTYGFKNAYTRIEAMLSEEEPDFIDIITPPNTHLELCHLAATKGIHIICQKPLAPSLEEAGQLTKLISNSPCRMMVHENFRFQPWHREIKKLLNSQTIGSKIHTINLRMRMGDGWQTDAYMDRQPYFREMERLLIYETGIHFIDVFRFFFGEVASVSAKLRTLNSNIKGEDFAWVNFEFDSGVLGFLDANRYNESTAKNPRLTFGHWLIEGDKGALRLYEDGSISIQKLGGPELRHGYSFKDQNFAGDCVYNTQRHFVESLHDNTPFETSVSDYMNNLRVQEAIYTSHLENRPISMSLS